MSQGGNSLKCKESRRFLYMRIKDVRQVPITHEHIILDDMEGRLVWDIKRHKFCKALETGRN